MRHILNLSAAAVLATMAMPGIAQANDTPPPSSTPGGGGQGGHGGGSPTSVPEPGTLGLLGGGIVAVAIARRARRKKG
ncbi:PEP-CTERM sorting domain-containing protein [Stakelama tenebrarum]|uniref:PEP-CTERM sorting domain-containing protein n=1 Tax=Stakelama tenebrarum TaxID=2711215 RepID=A0A6G6Y754_9SPHN|nr:PEP-CTERM sorting domain-containing protein [Sphingosinithalassobacter tenebrarum]QIG80681.1 PEP-CTERM sorting domain-containing protein [Sphingosinithalassobacter tenebrarum]